MTFEKMQKFAEKASSEDIKPYIVSEKDADFKVEHKEGEVWEIYGKTFDRDVRKSEDDVIILYYSEGCGNRCKKALKVMKEGATKYQKVKGLHFAKMDWKKNESPQFRVEREPQMVIYSGKNGHTVPIEMHLDRKNFRHDHVGAVDHKKKFKI